MGLFIDPLARLNILVEMVKNIHVEDYNKLSIHTIQGVSTQHIDTSSINEYLRKHIFKNISVATRISENKSHKMHTKLPVAEV